MSTRRRRSRSRSTPPWTGACNNHSRTSRPTTKRSDCSGSIMMLLCLYCLMGVWSFSFLRAEAFVNGNVGACRTRVCTRDDDSKGMTLWMVSNTNEEAAKKLLRRTKRHLTNLQKPQPPPSPPSSRQEEQEVSSVLPYQEELKQRTADYAIRSANALKAELSERKLKKTGRKPDLALRLATHDLELKYPEFAILSRKNRFKDDVEYQRKLLQDDIANAANANQQQSQQSQVEQSLSNFGGLQHLSPRASTALSSARVTHPTPIQSLSLSPITSGSSCILHAETGSGKTLAYLLPITETIWKQHGTIPTTNTPTSYGPNPQDAGFCLVVTPTRELAAQVASVATVLAPPGTVGLVKQPTNLWNVGREMAQGVGFGAATLHPAATVVVPEDTTNKEAIWSNPTPRILVGSAKALHASLYGDGRTPVSPTPKPMAKKFVQCVRWLVLDEVDRLLDLSKGKKSSSSTSSTTTKTRPKKQHTHEKPAAILTSSITKYTLGASQIIAASATVGRPLRRELSRVMGLSPKDCPPVLCADSKIGAGGNGGVRASVSETAGTSSSYKEAALPLPRSRAVTIPPTVQHYIHTLPPPTTPGKLLTQAASSILSHLSSSTSTFQTKKVLVVLSNGCELSVRHAVGALKHFGVRPVPMDLLEVLQAESCLGLIAAHRRVSGSDGVAVLSGSGSAGGGVVGDGDDDDAAADNDADKNDNTDNDADDEGYILVTSEDNVRGLHLEGLEAVVVVGRPKGPDEYAHVAGRTGRMGKQGRVVSVVSQEQGLAMTSSWRSMLGVEFHDWGSFVKKGVEGEKGR